MMLTSMNGTKCLGTGTVDPTPQTQRSTRQQLKDGGSPRASRVRQCFFAATCVRKRFDPGKAKPMVSRV